MGWIARTRNTPRDGITNSGSPEEARSPGARNRDLDPRSALLLNLDPVEVKVVVRGSEGKSVINVLIVSDAYEWQLPGDAAVRRLGKLAQVNHCTRRHCGDLNCGTGPFVVEPDSLRVVVKVASCVFDGKAQCEEPT